MQVRDIRTLSQTRPSRSPPQFSKRVTAKQLSISAMTDPQSVTADWIMYLIRSNRPLIPLQRQVNIQFPMNTGSTTIIHSSTRKTAMTDTILLLSDFQRTADTGIPAEKVCLIPKTRARQRAMRWLRSHALSRQIQITSSQWRFISATVTAQMSFVRI